MNIAIDFDGTCVTHDFPRVGKDIGAAEVLRELVDQGHGLILFTMRSNKTGNTGTSKEVEEIHEGPFLDHAVEWFYKNNIPLHGIQKCPTQHTWTESPKVYAQMIIDDTALGCPLIIDRSVSMRPFVDWKSVRKILIEQCIITHNGQQS